MAALYANGFDQTAQRFAGLLQSHRINGPDAMQQFQQAMRHEDFNQPWEQLWRTTAQRMGGQIDLAAVVKIVRSLTSLLDISDDWHTTCVFAIPALEALVSSGAFDGFTGWIFASSEPGSDEQEERGQAIAA